MGKKTVLYRIAYLVEVDEEELEKENLGETSGPLLAAENAVCRNIETEGGLVLAWESCSSVELDPRELNCGRCAECGRWVSDCQRESRIPELCHGATVHGRLLCDEHLPTDHRWAF